MHSGSGSDALPWDGLRKLNKTNRCALPLIKWRHWSGSEDRNSREKLRLHICGKANYDLPPSGMRPALLLTGPLPFTTFWAAPAPCGPQMLIHLLNERTTGPDIVQIYGC
jgi:hypothetical protein